MQSYRMAFYEQQPDEALRFGDVVTGFLSAYPHFQKAADDSGYEIQLAKCPFAVVITPCCSIGHKRIALCPLARIIHGR